MSDALSHEVMVRDSRLVFVNRATGTIHLYRHCRGLRMNSEVVATVMDNDDILFGKSFVCHYCWGIQGSKLRGNDPVTIISAFPEQTLSQS